jgi:4'-phosphopantetheinyl transferase
MSRQAPEPRVEVWTSLTAEEVLESYAGARLERGAHGRPVVGGRRDLSVSISRTAGLTLVAVGRTCRVGVDVEAIRDRRLDHLPAHALTEREQQHLAQVNDGHRLEAFLSYWTRKEALLKAAGFGLAIEPNLIELPPPGTSTRVLTVPDCLGEAGSWSVTKLPIAGFAAAVAADVPSPRMRFAGTTS